MWKEIRNYEGLYEVSDCGEVRRIGGNILKPQNESHGYLSVSLSKQGVRRSVKIHRLVAHAYLQHKYGCDVINHIDGNKKNNDVINLEWTTTEKNNLHAWKSGLNHSTKKQRDIASELIKKAALIARKINKRRVICLNNGVVYESIKDAENELGVDHSKISAVAKGKRSHSKGYRFAYADGKS